MTETEISPTFQLAADFVQFSNQPVFLTGKAGTGKTTFLRYIKTRAGKETAIVAPTGVAAINAGGTTIHSFFQLPLIPYLPEAQNWTAGDDGFNDRKSLLAKMKINNDRRKVFQSLELLVIDEISMVRADILDQIDVVLRHFRFRPNEPFGGVQLLMIGDMFQLPPVVSNSEWTLLRPHYKTQFFFSSRVLQDQKPIYIAFEKIYRQKDQLFIDVLNAVRENRITPEVEAILESRYQPQFHPEPEEGYITLTSHNYQADDINLRELDKLAGKPSILEAQVVGDFSAKAYPAEEQLSLKVGAQVMFLKNDKEMPRRYFNGKIGTVKAIEEETIIISCKDEPFDIELTPYKWPNIRYVANEQNQQMDEEEVGSFTQFPLRLAWAITIHKSQGLTFEKAVIDAGEAFAAGQVYVALSRCTSLEGMVLKSRIRQKSLQTDGQIQDFSTGQLHPDVLVTELEKARQAYQGKIILDLFDFSMNERQIRGLQKNIQENESVFNPEVQVWLVELIVKLNATIEVGKKFQNSLTSYMNSDQMPEENKALQERLMKSSVYFQAEFETLIALLHASPATTDNKALAKKFNQDTAEINTRLSYRKYLIGLIKDGFRVVDYQLAKSKFEKPECPVNAWSGAKNRVDLARNSSHPELYQELKAWRDEKAESQNLPIYMVLPSTPLKELVKFLPQTPQQLLQIAGFGKKKVDQYGAEILEMIREYCADHGLEPTQTELPSKRLRSDSSEETKAKKPDSKLASYTLFHEGKTVAQIAEIRGFVESTIESHLSYYVKTGQLDLNQFVSAEKQEKILPYLEKEMHFGEIKAQLGDAVTYGEIRMVASWKERIAEGESKGAE